MGKHGNQRSEETVSSCQSSDYSSSCNSTIDALKEVCPPRDNGCRNVAVEIHRSKSRPCQEPICCDVEPSSNCTTLNSCDYQGRCGQEKSRYDPGVCYFSSMITPVSNLTPAYSGTPGVVEFRMRRKNKTVTLQWEPFVGSMAQSGVTNLVVSQTIYNTPPYKIFFPILIDYKGLNRFVMMTIDPNNPSANIRFFLNMDASSTGVNVGDAFQVYGGAVTWIVD